MELLLAFISTVTGVAALVIAILQLRQAQQLQASPRTSKPHQQPPASRQKPDHPSTPRKSPSRDSSASARDYSALTVRQRRVMLARLFVITGLSFVATFTGGQLADSGNDSAGFILMSIGAIAVILGIWSLYKIPKP